MRAKSIVFLVAVAITGCGDDGEQATRTEAATATKAVPTATPVPRFVAEAEAICADANEKETALGAPGIDWIHSEYFTDLDFLTDFNAIGRSSLRKLRKLAPPEEDREGYETVLASIAEMVRGLDKQIAAVRSGGDAYDAVKVYERGYLDLAAAGGRLGLTECLGILL
jgi:hypothetical protein